MQHDPVFQVLQMLLDPENQPHQFDGLEDEELDEAIDQMIAELEADDE